MFLKYASIGGPACSCSARMPLRLAESCKSAVSTPFSVKRDVIALGPDFVGVPVLQLHDGLGFFPAVHQQAALAALLVNAAPVVVLRHIGLVAGHNPLRARDAAKLNAAVVIAQLGIRPQNEIPERLLADQEFIVLERIALRRSHNHAIAHRPQLRIAVPAGQVFAIEKGLKPVFGEQHGGAQRR